MTGYLINFIVYTTAMIGVIFLALFTFKKFSNICLTKKSSMLNIEDTMRLSARKTLYVVKANNEKFLIAADIDKTALIAKLDDGKSKLKMQLDESDKNSLDNVGIISNPIEKPFREDKSESLSSFDGISAINEFSSVIDFNKKKVKKGPMMKELAKKLQTL